MAITTKAAAGFCAGMLLAFAPRTVTAQATGMRRVVLHVADYANISAKDLAAAERTASEVYARAGVRLVWTDGYASGSADDGASHFDVIILSGAMTEQRRPRPLAQVFGQASHDTRHAFIYAARIFAHADETKSDPDLVLGFVLAHEIGHMLLPTHCHSPAGLMRAEWEGRFAFVPGFLPTQVAMLRAELAAE